MEANTVFVSSNLREPYRLTTINDSHVGSANCAKDLLKKKVQEIADDDYMLWVGLGDYAEFIVPSDPRFDPSNMDADIISLNNLGNLRAVYTDYLTELLWPIRHKCIAFGEGNHEEKYSSHNDGKMAWDIAKNLEIHDHFTGWAGFTNIVFKDGNRHSDSFMVFHSHGYAGGRKGGSLVNALDDLMGFMEADIYLQGHSHQYISKDKISIYMDGDKIYQRHKVGWNCGSFLKTYEMGTVGYSERKQYPPNVLWTPTVTISPARDGHGYLS
jgi:hypothetical protein